MNEYGTADSFFYCLYYSLVKDNRPFIFSRSCLVFNVLVHSHVESQQISLDSCLSLSFAATGLQKEVTRSKTLCNRSNDPVARQIFYLLHGNIGARISRSSVTFFFFFFFSFKSNQALSAINCLNFSFDILRVLLHACSSLFYDPFFATFRP